MLQRALLLDERPRDLERTHPPRGVARDGEEPRERVPHAAVSGIHLVRRLERGERGLVLAEPHAAERLREPRLHPPRFAVDRRAVRLRRRGELPQPPERIPPVEVGIGEPGIGGARALVEPHREPVIPPRGGEHPEVEPGERGRGIELGRRLEVRERLAAPADAHERGTEVQPDDRDLGRGRRGALELDESIGVPRFLEEARPPAQMHPPADRELAHGREVRVGGAHEEHATALHLGACSLPVAEGPAGEPERVMERAGLRRDAERLLEVARRPGGIPIREEGPSEPALRRGAGGIPGDRPLVRAPRLGAAVEVEREVAERDPCAEEPGVELRGAAERADRFFRTLPDAQRVPAQVGPARVRGEQPLRLLVGGDRRLPERVRLVDHSGAAVGETALLGRERSGARLLELGPGGLEVRSHIRFEVGEVGPGETGRGRAGPSPLGRRDRAPGG